MDDLIDNYEKTIEMQGQEYDQKKSLYYAVMYKQWIEIEKNIKELGGWKKILEKDFSEYTPEDGMPSIRDLVCYFKDYFDMKYQESSDRETIGEISKETPPRTKEIINKLFEEGKLNEEEANGLLCKIDQGADPGKAEKYLQCKQRIYDVKYIEKQTLAAQQVMNNNMSLVLDEVGTGKTVSALYAIQMLINEEKKHNQRKKLSILIVCPYGKREDWRKDIIRQLELPTPEIIDSKKDVEPDPPPFRIGLRNEINIVITGNKKNQIYKESKEENIKWDLLIIDEAHECVDSYEDLRAERVMMLTATPIVRRNGKIWELNDFKELMTKITDKDINKSITPLKDDSGKISLYSPNKDDIFVCHFKEDLFNDVKIERNIVFVECKRCEKREKWFQKLRSESYFKAIYADQDDVLLAKAIGEEYLPKDNKKLQKLMEVIENNNKELVNNNINVGSAIVFCERISTATMIYDRLSDLNANIVVGLATSKNHRISTGKTVNDNIKLMQEMKSQIINEKKRGILVITAKTGGTGLNLGEYDTIIHYELPFTSNNLEQRFGRIERADDIIKKSIVANNDLEKTENKRICNNMIFLVNEENNRMLDYCISRIYITYRYVPIRNTVLFSQAYFDFFNRNIKDVQEKVKNNIVKIKDYVKAKQTFQEYIKKLRDPAIIDTLEECRPYVAKQAETIKSHKDKGYFSQDSFREVPTDDDTENVKKAAEIDYSETENLLYDAAVMRHNILLVGKMLNNKSSDDLNYNEIEDFNNDPDYDDDSESNHEDEEEGEQIADNYEDKKTEESYKRIFRDWLELKPDNIVDRIISDLPEIGDNYKAQNVSGIFWGDCDGKTIYWRNN